LEEVVAPEAASANSLHIAAPAGLDVDNLEELEDQDKMEVAAP